MDPTANEKRLEEVKKALDDQFDTFFPEGIDGAIRKEIFQSDRFREVGYSNMPEKYGPGDQVMYVVNHEDGKRTFVFVYKVSSGEPGEVGSAIPNGEDLRETKVSIYQFDGKDKITETNATTGKETIHTGENGTLDCLLACIDVNLGKPVKVEDGDK